jgi:hypothetical protein
VNKWRSRHQVKYIEFHNSTGINPSNFPNLSTFIYIADRDKRGILHAFDNLKHLESGYFIVNDHESFVNVKITTVSSVYVAFIRQKQQANALKHMKRTQFPNAKEIKVYWKDTTERYVEGS